MDHGVEDQGPERQYVPTQATSTSVRIDETGRPPARIPLDCDAIAAVADFEA
jgi:hypothetical protein